MMYPPFAFYRLAYMYMCMVKRYTNLLTACISSLSLPLFPLPPSSLLPLSFSLRLLFYMIDACGSYQCYGIEILSPKGGLNLVTTAILYLAGSTVLLLFVSLYLSYVLPTEYGVRKSPFFPLIG